MNVTKQQGRAGAQSPAGVGAELPIVTALRRLYIDVSHTDNAGHIAERVADPAADIIESLVAVLTLARSDIVSLADQQAMPDDSYTASLAAIDAALLRASLPHEDKPCSK